MLPRRCEELLGREGGEEGVSWEEAVTDLPLIAARSPTLAESELAGKARHAGGLREKSTLKDSEEERTNRTPSLRAASLKGCAWCYRVHEDEEDCAGGLWCTGVVCCLAHEFDTVVVCWEDQPSAWTKPPHSSC